MILQDKVALVTGGTSFDYIVIGAGSAGCVVANRLRRFGSNRTETYAKAEFLTG